jgi:hypothetical protein
MKDRCIDVHGVKLSPEEAMRFQKYIAVNTIAMNTKTSEERKEIVINWLKKRATPGLMKPIKPSDFKTKG